MKTRYLVMAMRTPRFHDDVIAPHHAFLEGLREAGLLEMTGGFSDRTGGAYLLAGVASLEEARGIAARDPLAVTGSSILTVHEWNIR
ncbi:YciI family protein [Pseudoxanthomonas sp.]|uniref:YciI family protein n=1 Tax=Pseudoxanthomonas sp. TaxID=1871049 RepID=UPI003F817545